MSKTRKKTKKSRQYAFLEKFLRRSYSRAELAYYKCGNHGAAMNCGINEEMEYFLKHKRLSKEGE